MKRAYLDNAATTHVLPEVLEAMLSYLKDSYGNPQSLHDWGDEVLNVHSNQGELPAFAGLPEFEQGGTGYFHDTSEGILHVRIPDTGNADTVHVNVLGSPAIWITR